MALEQNILPDQFWEFSVLDILDILEARKRQNEIERQKWKAKIELQFATAQAIASRIGYIFGNEKSRRISDILMPWHVYPTLFEDQSELIQKQQDDIALQNYKTGFAAYADRWNERIQNGT